MTPVDRAKPRRKPAEARRDDLMGAAEALFLAKGVAATTIEEITNGAGVAKGTFYLYFSSKDDVLAALGDRFAARHLARVEAEVAAAGGGWRERLRAWAEACASGYLDAIRLHDVLFYEARTPTREGLVDNIVIDHLAALLGAGTAADAWAVEDSRATAVFLFSGLHGAVDDAYANETRVDRRRLVARLQRLFAQVVGPPPGETI